MIKWLLVIRVVVELSRKRSTFCLINYEESISKKRKSKYKLNFLNQG